MREVLFRGKRADNGEWVYGYVFGDGIAGSDRRFIGEAVITDYNGKADDKYEIGCSFYEVIPETVGEYVALNDKNGTKIFEGDIVYAPFWIPNGNGKGVICFRYFAFRIVWEDANHCDDLLSYMGDIEVIGNVHDNPELLENSQNFS